MRGYSNYWTRQYLTTESSGGVERRHRTGIEHQVSATVHSGRNKYLRDQENMGLRSKRDLVLAFSDGLSSALSETAESTWYWDRTVLHVMSSWRLYYKLLYCRLKMNLKCWHAVGGKNCILSHLKTQCLPSAKSSGIEGGTPCEAAWGMHTWAAPVTAGSLLATSPGPFLSTLLWPLYISH